MTSFLDKLTSKLNGNSAVAPAVQKREEAEKEIKEKIANAVKDPDEDFLEGRQLDVDLFMSPSRLIVYAMTSGVDPGDFDVLVYEENDVLTIKGSRKRPKVELPAGELEEDGRFLMQECKWDVFYRKLILPAEVDIGEATAVMKKGVLMVSLPIRKVGQGKKLKVSETISASKSTDEKKVV